MKLTSTIILLLTFASIAQAADLQVKHDQASGKIEVFRSGEDEPIVTQNARPDFRPFIHPIVAPDGKGVLTEYSPGHHKHQTGLYWGFTRVNGRDYFHHPEADYWRRLSAKVLQAKGDHVRWQTVYDLLGEDGKPILTETQTWTMHERDGEYVLDLDWSGEAKTDITIGKYDYGGLFLRMPWRRGIKGEVVNGARQRGARAEGQRAPWVDVGMQVEGRDDLAHIAIFDHSKNPAYPQPWRVDGQMGIGPVRARLGDWHIEKGETAHIKHQLLVYTGQLNDVALTEKWSEFSGQGGTWALWGLAQQEGRAAKFLTPQEAIQEMTLQDGFQVNAFAHEPMITQPMAFCWDDRGRMWIAENRDYESRGGGFSNSGDSRILILEDTDRDGVADSRKVFAEGIPFPSAIAVGFDGLWLGAPPNLLFVPDRNRDDQADMDDIEVRLTGWGIRDRHETLNSFHWGPDGWLYGCQGFATPSKVGKPAGKGRLFKHKEPFPKNIQFANEPVDINGGVFRYHPTKDRFEVVAHGFSNPWGIDYDAKGQLFISACVIPHLWHVVPGGIYHRQGGRHFNPYVYSDIRTIADHRHRSAHGGARIYISDAFPQKYHDRIFMANIHEHAVLTDIMEPKGSGFVGKHGDDFLLANNAQWIGFSMEIGPEGAVYVLDWHDADICGKEVLNKDTGRVFRITPTKSNAEGWEGRYADLTTLSDVQLAKLQESARRVARAAGSSDPAASCIEGFDCSGGQDALTSMFREHSDSDIRLRALWALHVIGGLNEGELMSVLDEPDQHLRAWAIQLLCEDMLPSFLTLDRFNAMARDDTSPVVRLYLAAALQRIDEQSRWPIARALVQHAQDNDDPNIPKMIWFGIESMVPDEPQRALELAELSKIPMLSRFIGRRLADDDKLKELVAGISESSNAPLELLNGMRDALEGQPDITAPEGWNDAYARLQARGGEAAQISLELAQQFGDTGAVQRLVATLTDDSTEVESRRQALRALAIQQHEQLKPRLLELLQDDALRRDAIRAIASFDDEQLSAALLEQYDDFSLDDKLEAVQTLASRPRYGRRLAQAIKSGEVPRRDVPAYVARQLRRVVGNSFVDVWGPIDALPADTEAAFTKYRALLTKEALSFANASHGRAVFKRTCHACHTLYGDGGVIGPEITGANRINLDYVLSNMLTPSAEIQDAYKMSIVLTDDGRIYSGILAGENDRQITLRIANEPEPRVIAKSTIESREIAAVSMMPEGMLPNLSDREVLDLVAYLQTPLQVPLPDDISPDGFTPIFDGKSLTGWHAVPKDSLPDWSVRDGVLVGSGTKDRLSYLVYDDEDLADFELKLSYRMKTDGNTGIEIRSRVDTTGKRPFEGYHADLGHVGIGPQVLGAWDFHFATRKEYPCQRGTRLVIDAEGNAHSTKIPDAVTLSHINERDWNEVHVIARGNNFTFHINGKPAAEFTDNTPEWLERGAIGLQIHDAGMTVEFKDIALKRLTR